jgi:very-short-patch-repair endonuclease
MANKELTFEYLDTEYNKKERSFAEIANDLGTYSNKVRRAAIQLGIQPRSKSQAQSLALKHGRIEHPTEGKKRDESVRHKIADGAKMENFVLNKLRSLGYVVQFHRKGLLSNERLEVDLFLPELKTVIEIDGPSHFLPIWGEESLARNLKADAQKTGLLITRGFAIIRVKHISKHVSEKQMRDLTEKIIEQVELIDKKFPTKKKRLIQIEV